MFNASNVKYQMTIWDGSYKMSGKRFITNTLRDYEEIA